MEQERRWSFTPSQMLVLLAILLDLCLTAFWAGRVDARIADMQDRIMRIEHTIDGKVLRSP